MRRRVLSAFPKRPMSGNLRACLFMMAAMGGFVVNDTCTKLAIVELGVHQIMAVRSLMATVLLLSIAALRGALRPPRSLATRPLAFRTLSDVGATMTYIAALASMPIANASAIFQALPLAITLGAALFLAEPVGWRRWTAILVGFVGVIVIVRPGAEGFTAASLLVLLSVVFSAARDLLTRRVAGDVSALMIAAVTATAVSATGWLLVPFEGWDPIPAPTFLAMAVGSVGVSVGYICIVEATRSGDIGFVSPFRYTILLFAIVMGMIVFGNVPDPLTLLGAAIVVASGIYSLYRERVRDRPKVIRTEIH